MDSFGKRPNDASARLDAEKAKFYFRLALQGTKPHKLAPGLGSEVFLYLANIEKPTGFQVHNEYDLDMLGIRTSALRHVVVARIQ